MSFNSFNLDLRVVAGLPKDYSVPTPIQEQAIPHVLAGKDVLGLAQTGTGKTAAFVLPILNRLVATQKAGASEENFDGDDYRSSRGKRRQPAYVPVRALIVAPTRELAEQIWKAVQTLGARTGVTSTTIYGGVAFGPQAQRLRRGVDIVVACPGRLLDHLEQRTIDLSQVEVLVLDEADHMFDMGFLPSVRRIVRAVPKERQSLLFSATMPQEVRGLVSEVLVNPEVVQIGERAPVKSVAQTLYPVDQGKKTDLLLQILKGEESGSVLVFARTKHRVSKLGDALHQAGHRVASLQGGLSQQRRQAALSGFRTGRFRVLVATDIAARGIDVAGVTHVINYDVPDTVDAYTHRIGRTGRAQRTGDAITFVTHEDESMVRSIERLLGENIARIDLDGFARTGSSRGSSEGRSFGRRGGGYAGRGGSGRGGPRGYSSSGGSQGRFSRGGPSQDRGPRTEGSFARSPEGASNRGGSSAPDSSRGGPSRGGSSSQGGGRFSRGRDGGSRDGGRGRSFRGARRDAPAF